MHRLSAYVIVHRTQSNQTADGNRSDGGRNPIRQRTETDRMADAITRGCSCLSCTNKANRARTAPTKQTEQELHQQSKQSKNCTNKAYRTIHQGVQLSQLHQQSLQNHQSPKINKAYRAIISRTAALSTPSAVSCATQPRATDSANRWSLPSCRAPPHSRCPPPRAQPRAAAGNGCRR